MQTSGNSSLISRSAGSRTTRVAGVGMVVGLIALASSSWLSCAPGTLDCDKVSIGECAPNTGGGPGGSGDIGGGGGGGVGGGGGTAQTGGQPPSSCTGMGINNQGDFESKFIAPRCGMMGCHQAIFPPRNLDNVANIQKALVGVKGMVLCKNDSYIDTANPMNSFVLAKIMAPTADVKCPSGGAANSGGTRMPNKTGSAGTAGDPLMPDELDCFKWYVTSFKK
jgi:hypothetical protein